MREVFLWLKDENMKEFELLNQVELVASNFWYNRPVTTAEKQGSEVAVESWSKHELGKPASFGDKVALSVLSEQLLYKLAVDEYPPQPYSGVYFERTRPKGFEIPKVGLYGIWQGAEQFWNNGELAYISFETNPNLSTKADFKDRRWLILRGYNHVFEDTEEHWEVGYELNGSEITKASRKFKDRKWERGLQESIDKSDVRLIETILDNMLSAMEDFKPMVIEEGGWDIWDRR